jgi:hypothetical protein
MRSIAFRLIYFGFGGDDLYTSYRLEAAPRRGFLDLRWCACLIAALFCQSLKESS